MSNSWQKSMYDEFFAKKTLDSDALKKKAKEEVSFLIKTLGLPSGAQILDIPCGTGRHSFLLAEAGYNVLGLDISPSCIEIAQKNILKNLSYQIGNMQDLSNQKDQFDCTLNLFSSFGYFETDKENEQVLEEMISTLKPGGKLVLNLINRNWLLGIYRPAFWFKDGPLLTVNAGNYDPQTHYNESYMTLKDEVSGATTLSYHRIRLYSPEEIIRLMQKYGLKNVKAYGSYQGEALDELKSSHPFYFGEK